MKRKFSILFYALGLISGNCDQGPTMVEFNALITKVNQIEEKNRELDLIKKESLKATQEFKTLKGEVEDIKSSLASPSMVELLQSVGSELDKKFANMEELFHFIAVHEKSQFKNEIYTFWLFVKTKIDTKTTVYSIFEKYKIAESELIKIDAKNASVNDSLQALNLDFNQENWKTLLIENIGTSNGKELYRIGREKALDEQNKNILDVHIFRNNAFEKIGTLRKDTTTGKTVFS